MSLVVLLCFLIFSMIMSLCDFHLSEGMSCIHE